MELVVLVVAAALAVAAVWFVLMYNGLVGRRVATDATWAQIDVQLKRRQDLVPNLVAAVRGYMGFEQDVLTAVTEARANAVAVGAGGPAASAAAEGALSGALRSLFAVVENYPDLRANENVSALQAQLATTEDQISTARDGYTAGVREYNTAISTFPAVVMARPMGFDVREFFEAEAEPREVPGVQLR